ncbi:SHUGOSHIN 2-like isoform X3 [Cucurbita maxima]|uniref:SHUGOSHIN 2-like isoform X3 n=1 Tax=Cucurbita maxima TaxID=3661 RepID=A0A6J1JX77_CUCMA|nr:SHUGOSHIN 2-like isoform X3 [Cucurbita maxima]
MECNTSLDSKNYGVGASQNMEIAGVKTMKSSKVGGSQRKRLSDISNLKEQPILQKRDTKPQSSLLKTYEYVDKLQKENMALTKVLAERNRIIEISGNELETLRTNFQKLQQQNLQFAQANSQMLAELNSGKERLKALQHELGCKNGILMSRKLDLERKGKSATFQPGGVGTAKSSEAAESMNTKQDNRPCKTNRRRQSRQESFGTSVLQTEVQKVEGKRPRRQSARFKTEEPVAANDILETDNSNSNNSSQCKETSVRRAEVQKVEGKRPCSRRQSARLKIEEPVATNDLLGIENFNSTDASQCRETSVLQTEVQKVEGIRPCLRRQSARFKLEEPVAIKDSLDTVNSNSTSASLCKEIVCEIKIVPTSSVETKDNGNSTDRSEVQECRRTSVGRPLRRAAEKIQSYKEIPLNVKMRRPQRDPTSIGDGNECQRGRWAPKGADCEIPHQLETGMSAREDVGL